MSKTNFRAGKYALVKEIGVNGKTVKGETIYVNLTATQAKVMFSIYDKLDFASIEYIPE